MRERAALRHTGKAKRVWDTDDADLAIIEYTDAATAFNGEKRDVIAGKGSLNAQISAILMTELEAAGVPTHMVEALSDREHLVRKVAIVPLEVVVRNTVAGSLATRTGLPEGAPLPRPIVELYYKRDDLGDPMLNRAHVAALALADAETVDAMEDMAMRVNTVLVAWLEARGLQLVDFKLEFGITPDGTLLLADEVSPDTCRIWDLETGERLDKDRFRRDLGDLVEGYQSVFDRLTAGAPA